MRKGLFQRGPARAGGARGVAITLGVAAALGAAALGGCGEEVRGTDHPTDRLHFPTSIAADPDGRHLYVVNSNFDLLYRGGSVVVVDLATNRILPESTIQVGTFPGKLVLETNAETTSIAGYLPDRDADALTWFRIERKDGTPDLRCTDGAPTSTIEACSPEYSIGEATINGATVRVGDNPFGAGIRHMGPNQDNLLMTGSLLDGRLGIWRLADDGTPSLLRSVQLQAGLHGISTSAATGTTYVSSHFAAQIYALKITDGPRSEIGPEHLNEDGNQTLPQVTASAVNISNVTAAGDYGHGLALDAAGTRAYVAYRSPPGVVVFDISAGPNGNPRNQVLGMVALGARPSELAVVPRADGKGDLVYVVCFGSGDLWVVDTLLMEVVDRIPVGIGPYDIAIVQSETVGIRAYVSMFEQDSVAIVELDPKSPFHHQVIAEIR